MAAARGRRRFRGAGRSVRRASLPLRCFLVQGLLHGLVEGLPGCACLGVARAARPVGVGGNHQLARRVDEDALPKDAARGKAAVVVRPPLVAVAAAFLADRGLAGGGLLQPALGHGALAACGGAVQDEQPEAGVVAGGRLDAAAADLLPRLAQDPGGLLFHARGLPDLFFQVLRQGLARGLADQNAHQVGFARAVEPALARGRGARQLAQVAHQRVHAGLGRLVVVELRHVGLGVAVVLVPAHARGHREQLAHADVVIGRTAQSGDILRHLVVEALDIAILDRRTDKMIAVGEKAKMMYEKTHDNIRTIRPLRDGVIADFTACEQMMRGLIKMVHTGSRLFSPSLRMVIGVPSGSTEVELRAVRDSAEHADGRDVYLIFEPMAAAIGIGIDVEAPEGNMIVDIGGGSTEIAVISLGGIVSNNSIRTAGDDLTADIQEYMSRQHNVKVSERMAERIKIHVGSALTDLGDEAPEDFIVHGPNRITALPMEVPVCYQEIAHCLDKTVAKIENAVLSALENTPPELYADIVKNGIWLSGGGALLRGLDKRLQDKINIPFHIAEDPLHSVAKGAGIALKNVDRFSFLMR